MNKLRILVDLDGIIVNMLSTWLDIYNDRYKDNLTVDQITDWNTHLFAKKDVSKKEFYAIIKEPEFFMKPSPYAGAVSAVKELRKNYNVCIATSPAGNYSAKDKLDWVKKYLDMGHDEVIITAEKDRISADLLIDDKPKTIKKWVGSGRRAMTIAHPYNKEIKGYVHCYANSYKDTDNAWAEILESIRQLEAMRESANFWW